MCRADRVPTPREAQRPNEADGVAGRSQGADLFRRETQGDSIRVR
jgi:hypothetical protein